MGKALYRTYRSKNMAEIVGQEHITQTLNNALKQDKISHAYLFTGPRGVGKTSIARILAHEINGLPYTDDAQHIDIIEIDAASNRRIDEIRDLRDKVHVAPTSAKYKVYIIDEVHMLTREAFNALLKTLEEPPAHVVFILATTDAHKVPDTIISRTQRFSFKPVPRDQVIDHLAHIASEEGISITPEALGLLADHGQGSFRDSISLLDQAAGQGTTLDESNVRQLLGIPPADVLDKLLDALSLNADASIIAGHVSGLYDAGYQAAAIAGQLGDLIRAGIVQGTGKLELQTALTLLDKLLEVPAAFQPERYLEIVLLGYSQPKAAVIPTTVKETKPKSAKSVNTPQPKEEKKPAVASAPAPAIKQEQPTEPTGEAVLDEALWPQILGALKQKYNTLYGVVRMAQPTFGSDHVTLAFNFSFHQKRVNEASNRKIITDIIQKLTGRSVKLECVYEKTATPAKNAAALDTISNIFGGGEVLES